MKKTKAASIIEYQILKSGTSCSLNYSEAIGAESSKDFVHKIQVVLKELRETYTALRIIEKARLSLNNIQLNKGLNESNQLINIFVKSVNTNRNRIIANFNRKD